MRGLKKTEPWVVLRELGLQVGEAVSPTDAWAAGEYCPLTRCTTPSTLILHWNGTAWTQS